MTAESSSPRDTWLGFGIATAIGLLAAQPLLMGQLRAGSDTYFHVHRLWQVHELVNQGVWFSRWSPDLPFGFGYPVLNYYAPLSYYFAEVCARLTGGLISGYILALILIICATAMGMFAWLREIFDERAAWVAAAGLVFAPHPVFVIYGRGTLAEPMAVAFVPMALWAVYRIMGNKRWRDVLWLALAFALLCLSHNVSAFMFAPFIVAYALLLALRTLRQDVTGLILVSVGLAWGVALAACFVAPAMLERGLVQLELIYATFFYDYHNNFLHLSEFFSGPLPLDPRDMNSGFRFFVGVVPAGFALLGAIGLLRLRPAEQRLHIGFALFACVVSIFMAVPQSLPVWEAIPFLRVLQFPTRWMMPNAFFLAVLIGAACQVLLSLLPDARAMLKTACSALCIATLMAFVMPMLIVLNRFPLDYAPTALQIAQLEKQYNVIGTTNTGEYLPLAVKEIPPLEASALMRNGRYLDPQSLPIAAQVLSETYTPLRYDLTLDTPQAFDATFSTFYYPGWQATVDGVAVEINPSQPYGFIRVAVPAGQHRVRVAFGDTPIRTVANWVSLIAVGAWLILFVMLRLKRVDA